MSSWVWLPRSTSASTTCLNRINRKWNYSWRCREWKKKPPPRWSPKSERIWALASWAGLAKAIPIPNRRYARRHGRYPDAGINHWRRNFGLWRLGGERRKHSSRLRDGCFRSCFTWSPERNRSANHKWTSIAKRRTEYTRCRNEKNQAPLLSYCLL